MYVARFRKKVKDFTILYLSNCGKINQKILIQEQNYKKKIWLNSLKRQCNFPSEIDNLKKLDKKERNVRKEWWMTPITVKSLMKIE